MLTKRERALLAFACVCSNLLELARVRSNSNEFARIRSYSPSFSTPASHAQVLWWEPMYGKYSRSWRKWCDDTTKVQHKSTIKRNIIYFTNIVWTSKAPLKYGYRNLHKKVKERLQQDPYAKWPQFG